VASEIDASIVAGERRFHAHLASTKRRLEFRDAETREAIVVHGASGKILSGDFEDLEPLTETRGARVPSWDVEVRLKSFDSGLLVEVFLVGDRILALVI
jgi:hypothetical protein